MYELNILKDNFNEIKTIRRGILELIKNLENKIITLKTIYTDLLHNNKHSKNDTSLDTLYFQTKLITVELDNTNYIFKLIDNRIYGDYYKLYKNMIKYINKLEFDKKMKQLTSTDKYPEYNDLKLDIIYEFNITIDIHDNILKILEVLLDELSIKKNNYENEKHKSKSGINIDTLLHKINHTILVFEQDISLFNKYLLVYNKSHKKYLNRFMIKTKLFYGQVNSDIKLEETSAAISNLNIITETSDNIIFLNNNEEETIRNIITETSSELDSMLSGVLSTQNSESSNDNNNSDISPNTKLYDKYNIKDIESETKTKCELNKNIRLSSVSNSDSIQESGNETECELETSQEEEIQSNLDVYYILEKNSENLSNTNRFKYCNII
jgi:hypothetical protein|tara:strand:- start:1787 stop:2932 length:1146 start_codon:yes stop_codon:yes gene_type:complete